MVGKKAAKIDLYTDSRAEKEAGAMSDSFVTGIVVYTLTFSA